jgi:tryptophan-rich sensory protein
MAWLDVTLLAFVAVNVAVAMSGAVFSPGRWYDRLNKPSWQPPKWAFPIAWTILYAMIAVAGWLAWRTAGGFWGAPAAFAFYAAQLALNAGWSAIFFGLRRPGLALVEVACLWLAIVGNVATFYAVRPEAGWLLAPYLLWVSFAFVLNLAIWRLNPHEKGRTA